MFDVRAEPAPIAFDESGTARIAGTRVTLETVLWTFNEGVSAEEIASRFPSLSLSDVYAVITHYLHHRDEVDSYLHQSKQAEEAVIQRFEAISPQNGLREKLLARRNAAKSK